MTTFATCLPRDARSIRAARELIEIHGAGLSAPQREDAALMVSELVTNALIHGRGTITLRINQGRDDLTVEVADQGHGKVAIVPAPGAFGGWGLRVVNKLADEWGARRGSTRVWFRVLRDRPTG